MVFIGDALNTLGMADEAAQQYEKILRLAETGPETAKTAGRAVTRVRAQLAGLLRKAGKFPEAIALVDQLIKDNPSALEPLMEKGRILSEWAEQEPARYDDAVAHWNTLRTRLEPRPQRKTLPEYYDVMYNVAACLVREAERSDDKAVVADRALKAEQVLKAALIRNPKLDGPETVERYNTLLKKAIVLQGRAPP